MLPGAAQQSPEEQGEEGGGSNAQKYAHGAQGKELHVQENPCQGEEQVVKEAQQEGDALSPHAAVKGI